MHDVIKGYKNKYAVNPVAEFVKKAEVFIDLHYDVSTERKQELIGHILDKHLVNPNITMHYRENGEDTVPTTMRFLDYLRLGYDNGRVIVPTGTMYEDRKKRVSYLSKQLAVWLADRSVVKKKSFVARMKGLTELADRLFTLSIILKRYANALSGLLSTYSHLHTPSGHSTLTSLTAMSTSIANASNERYVAGGYHFDSVTSTIDYMLSCLTNIDNAKADEVIKKYGLVYVTKDQLMEVITNSTKFYFFKDSRIQEIESFVDTLSPLQRSIVTYTGSLYNLRKYNSDVVFEFINGIVTATPNEELLTLPKEVNIEHMMETIEEDVAIAVHHAMFNKLRGVRKGYIASVNDEDVVIENDIIASVRAKADNMTFRLDDWSDLVETLLHTKILPPNVAYFPRAVRRVVILSDTDSTCFTSEEWVDWYSNCREEYVFADSLGAMGIVSSMAIRCLSSHLVHYSLAMGVAEEEKTRINMKNEFTWSVFIRAANAAKHYVAGTILQEGNVYPSTRREVKGTQFKSVANSPKVRDEVYKMADTIIDRIMEQPDAKANTTTNITELKEVYEGLRQTMLDDLYAGDTTVLRTLTIKSPELYSDPNPYKTNARYLYIWNTLFGKTLYNSDFNEIFVKLPLKVYNKKGIDEFLTYLEDYLPSNDIEETRKLLVEMNRTQLNVFYCPLQFLLNNKIPEYLKTWVDEELLLANSLSPFILLLHACGLYISDYKK